MHGYHHVIRELTAENASLKKEVAGYKEEVKGLKEEVKLMEELSGEGQGEGKGDLEERKRDKAAIKDVSALCHYWSTRLRDWETIVWEY